MTLRVAIVMSVILGAMGQNVAASNSEQADRIIRQHIDARGGEQKIKSLHAIRATGRMEQMGMEIDFVLWTQRPNLARMDAVMQGRNMVHAYDGETAWWVNPFTGSSAPSEMPDDLKYMILRWVDFSCP